MDCPFIAERTDFVTYACTRGEKGHEGPHACHAFEIPETVWHLPAPHAELVELRDASWPGYSWLVPEDVA